MEDNKFFVWVWRINGIILLLAAIGVSGLALVGLYESVTRSSQEEVVVNLANDPKGIEKWTLGRAISVVGANTLMLSLISENEEVDASQSKFIASDRYYFSGNYGPAKNVLFINTESNNSFWLFKSTSQLVLNAEPFPYSYQASDADPVKVIFYQVVTSDTNGDGALNKKDKVSLAITSPDGSGYRIILKEFDKIISKTLSEDGDILVVYHDNGDVYSMLYDITGNKVLSTHKVPKVDDS